jgi:hypothetical protein
MKLSQNENVILIDYEKYVSMNVICKIKVWTKVFKQTKQNKTNNWNKWNVNKPSKIACSKKNMERS